MKPINRYHRSLCEYLSKHGIAYSEEYSVGPWSIDIYIGEMNLGIEVDGPSHTFKKKDEQRDLLITEQFGIPIIRIKVGTPLSNALEAILDTVPNS